MPRTLKATFIGPYEHLGYETGKEYVLTISTWSERGVQAVAPIPIGYASMRAFGRNWRFGSGFGVG